MTESFEFQTLPNNIVKHNKSNLPQLSFISLSFFPPQINIDKLFMVKPNYTPSKSSNAFIIYQKNFINHLYLFGISLKMTDVSPIISKTWKKKPEYVKNEYRRIADIAKIRFKELYPNSKCVYRRKKKKEIQPTLTPIFLSDESESFKIENNQHEYPLPIKNSFNSFKKICYLSVSIL
ncbi:10323_t:CDS:2 [Cetraspora pellucida]|uniref:10323_t:CDS:1 n=1 Tax=Cetraspora pellucida TaxID=1433469 RepID=A0A9N9K5F8_9GLOM|nr:10323_t:CDS:2 [Cetraspora pellucida]